MPTATASSSPRRSSGRPKGADSANRREEILAAATELFSIEGFRGVSMSAIARACGMSLTGLVHYFPSKDLLLQATMDRRDEVDQARIAGPKRARGWAYLESLVELVRHNQDQKGIVRLFTTVAAEAVDPEHPANSWLRHHHRASVDRILTALAEAIEDGALSPDAPAESIARSLIAAMDGLQVQWLSEPDYGDMAADFKMLLETVHHRWGQFHAPGIAR